MGFDCDFKIIQGLDNVIIFRQIWDLPISHGHVALSVCVCLWQSGVCVRTCLCARARVCVCVCVCVWCVCVCVLCKNRQHRSNLDENQNVKMTFIDFDVCNLAATLPVLYSITLTYSIVVKYFKCQYLENGESSQKCVCMKFKVVDIFHELDHFECCTSYPFPKFSRLNFLNG